MDTEALLQQQNEQTVSANVGAFPVPLGGDRAMLRRQFPIGGDYTIPAEYEDFFDLYYDDKQEA